MSVFWTWDGLKRNAPGVILFIGAFAIMLMLAANKWANDASPIRSVGAIDATIKGAQWRDGKYILYVLVLNDGSSVLIDDDRPHLIGSDASIERVTRDNGVVFYRFPE
ncbi:hypothetical protein CK228_04735 [Mesorhizobium sp. WSM4312]|nr:hypothetical protein CK228_04735 [Mesorhizobium sp. WSM4312]